MKIRSASPDDAPGVARLSTQLGYPSTVEQSSTRLASILAKDDHVIYVAELLDGEVAGWIHVHGTYHLQANPYAEIGGLVVDEAQRSLGIGKALVEAAEAWVRGHGYLILRVRCNVIRTRAHGFYRSLGFDLHKSQSVFIKQI